LHRGHQGRVAERCEQDRLDPLRLRQRGFDTQQGLPGEHDRPLGDGPDVPLEAELRERVEESGVDPIERRPASDGLHLFAREGESEQVTHGLFQPGEDEIGPPRGEAAYE